MDLERVSLCLKEASVILGYANLTFGIEPDSAFLNSAKGGKLDLEYVSSYLSVINVL